MKQTKPHNWMFHFFTPFLWPIFYLFLTTLFMLTWSFFYYL